MRALLPVLVLSLMAVTASALSTTSLEQILEATPEIRDLKVTQVGEVIVLRGTTDDASAVEAVERRLRELGYERIINAVDIERAPSDDMIRSSVERQIYLTPALASSAIRVNTNQGTVTLEGSCSTPAQISQADRIARSVRGVRDVKIELVVRPN